ncbi:MAG: mucoidy inhibitor MuiA family protein [Prolixibacteraceae bacterium]
MKVYLFIISLLMFGQSYAQEIPEKDVETKVNEVTVFIEGAQVTRIQKLELAPGTILLKFVNLSPFIDAKSVQVKAKGEVTVLSVNHQQNYLDKADQPKAIQTIKGKIEAIDQQLKLEETYLSILREELAFLKGNSVIGGKNNELSISNLKEASEFYSNKLTAIKLKEIERNKSILELMRQKNDLENQVNILSTKKEYPSGEVVVKVESKSKTFAEFELSYMVANAGWFPSYDIRAKNINEPLEIVYKANLRQDSKIDWNNVKLKFSSANPSTSGVAPELQTYYLGYNTRPPVYSKINNGVSGHVFDQDNQALPGVNVMVPGTSIGTNTDISGNYSIMLPANSNQLSYMQIGYEPKTLIVSGPIMNVVLHESNVQMDEVAVVAYASEQSRSLSGALSGVSIRGVPSLKSKKAESLAIPFQKTENQTSVDFEIKTPYTVKSGAKNYSVDMAVYQVPASYQYFCIPKIDKDAFLLANIIDWEQYNLMEGEANIFFEDTYIGKTLLDVRFAADTLQLSLGRDKNVQVNREKIKDSSSRQFIGTKQEETRAWRTIVKNNKNQPIQMILFDQVPLSSLEEIEVQVETLSGAKHDEENGEIKWEFSLAPSEKKEVELKYTVKYPKSKHLILE